MLKNWCIQQWSKDVSVKTEIEKFHEFRDFKIHTLILGVEPLHAAIQNSLAMYVDPCDCQFEKLLLIVFNSD